MLAHAGTADHAGHSHGDHPPEPFWRKYLFSTE